MKIIARLKPNRKS